MTGFRLAKGGAQELLGVNADIVTYGKVIGGGLPVGAFGARKEIMSYLAPDGPVYQAGTLSGNPLAMTSGLTTLQILNKDPDIYSRLSDKTNYLCDLLEAELNEKGMEYQLNRMGSMMSLHFTDTEVVDFNTSSKGNNELFKIYFHAMLDRGIYLPPSAFESYFLNDAMTYGDLDETAQAFREFLKLV
jgi:glutamate-1-semialdehyde 2,1-aminomutase